MDLGRSDPRAARVCRTAEPRSDEPTQSVVMRQTPDWLYRISGSLEDQPNCQSVGEADPPIEGTIRHNFTHSANGEGVPLGTPWLFGGDGWNGPPCGRPVAGFAALG